MSKRICIINVVGLTPALAAHAPRILEAGKPTPWKGPVPAVTSTAQATLLTGLPPSGHGIVANGWYERESGEIRFWRQANALIQGDKFYEDRKTAKMFWWFNQGAPVEWFATPKPHYGCDGSKAFDIIDATDCRLQERLGHFPFPSFWGPMAGLPSSDWIARASALVMKEKRPDITLVYLPHLDYDFQRDSHPSPDRVREVDTCAGIVIDAAREIEAEVVILSEYGIVPVSRTVMLNRELRRAGWLAVREGPFGEMLDTFSSRAFAVCDHQIAHIYVRDLPLDDVRARLEESPGVEKVVPPEALDLNHPRAGDLVACSTADAWFPYYYWLEDDRAPDFAPTVDIHRKPGYDPCELFMTSKGRAAFRLLQKKAGMRYRMDVVPLDPSLVGGSHGRPADDPQHGPLIIPPDAPDEMTAFAGYVKGLIS